MKLSQIHEKLICLAEKYCLAESDDVFNFFCTLPPNHGGVWHIARSVRPEEKGLELARWPSEMTPHICMLASQAESDATEFRCAECGTKWKLVETGLGHKWERA